MQEEERNQLLGWGRSQTRVEESPSVVALFGASVKASPDALAVADEDGSLTYAELDRQSDQVAWRLQQNGAERGTRVGICTGRNRRLIVAELATLKSGGAFVLLDPANPRERLKSLLDDAEPRVLVTEASLVDLFSPPEAMSVISLDRDLTWMDTAPENDFSSLEPSPDDVAYVIYTSGSTGTPKGVEVPHRGLSNLVAWTQRAYNVRSSDRSALVVSIGFDPTIFETWPYLTCGAALQIAPDQVRKDPELLRDWLVEKKVTLAVLPTPLAELALELTWPPEANLRCLLTGGDQLKKRPKAGLPFDFFNHYGPTESTVVTTWSRVEPVGGPISIGRPISNVEVYVLDEHLRLVPFGTAGELHIGGGSLANGYLNRRELTEERFIKDPFNESGRLYKTGDLVCWRHDGTLEFLGRNDEQVKIRGHRIELGEIEIALSAQEGVRQCAVLMREDESGEKWLAAYVVGAGNPAGWRRALQQRLPAYMTPAEWVTLDCLPVTSNGKVDRRALLSLQIRGLRSERQVSPPANALEAELVDLWARSLKLAQVGIDDNFFELGGDSIRAMVVVNELQARLSGILHAAILFDFPTISEFALYLRERYPDIDEVIGGDETANSLGQVSGALARLREEQIEEFRRMIPPTPSTPRLLTLPRNKRAVFILAPPRSGSSLLRILLAGNRSLFSPPELDLLPYGDLRTRREILSGRFAFFREGLVRAVMELRNCEGDEAHSIVGAWEDDAVPIADCYRQIQDWIQDRVLIDKTTTYSENLTTLLRAEETFDGPLYVHLTRHPCAVIRSFEEVRLGELLRLQTPFHQRHLAELYWLVSHQNILEFLTDIPRSRQRRVSFETLLNAPEQTLMTLTEFIGVPYEEAMKDPYKDSQDRMTDGVHELSRGLSDFKFRAHRKLDPSVADRWRGAISPDDLADSTRSMANRLDYNDVPEPREVGRENTITKARGRQIVLPGR